MILIITEGRDSYFISTYLDKLAHLYKGYSKEEIFAIHPNKIKKGEEKLGGYTILPKLAAKLTENTDIGGINLVIFDADDPSKPDGGKTARLKYLEAQINELGLEIRTFLLPNNTHDGDLETMLENVANDKHKHLFDSFDKFANCINEKIKTGPKPPLYKAPLSKSKIYAYIDTIKDKDEERFKKKDFLYDNTNIWNLDCPYLDEIKEFLTIQITEFIQKKGSKNTNP